MHWTEPWLNWWVPPKPADEQHHAGAPSSKGTTATWTSRWPTSSTTWRALRADGHRLLVHCHGAASRTGPVLLAWLMREEEMSADAAATYVAERWPHLGLWNGSSTRRRIVPRRDVTSRTRPVQAAVGQTVHA
jgi:hypothetical protein